MRKPLILLALGLCAGATLLGGVFGAYAWFQDQAAVPEQDSLVGASQGAYFARGTGVEGDPYIINRPIHLYNLAWLQYIGYFNDAKAPYYFALDSQDGTNTLDMSGWVIPPIGTTAYPFIGNFEGNNETIANLTVDNVIGADHIVKTPTLVDGNAKDSNGVLKTYIKDGQTGTFQDSTVDIMGLFGVTGEYQGMVHVSAEYADANIISSVALDGLKVSSGSEATLIGLACGYDNATFSGVAINGSELYAKDGAAAIGSITTNLSDYSLVGYATEKALRKCFVREDTASLPKIDNPNTDLGLQEWGGSIDMLHLYTQLAQIRDTHSSGGAIPATSAFTYPTRKYITDGVEDTSRTTTTTDNRTVDGYYYRYEGNQLAENDPQHNNPVYASFTFAREFGDDNYSYYVDGEGQSTKYNCLYGAKTFAIPNATAVTDTETCSQFRINKGSQYLTVTNKNGKYTIGSTTTANDGTVFYLDPSNRLVCTVSSKKIYLRNNSGTLTTATTESSGSIWSWDSTKGNLSTGDYFLTYDSGWKLVYSFSTPYYTIRAKNAAAGRGYLARSSYYDMTTSNEAGAQKWGYGNVKTSNVPNGANGYYDITKNPNSSGYRDVLGYYGNYYDFQCYYDSNYFVTLASGQATGEGKLVGNGRYLVWDGSSFSTSTDQASGTTFEVVRRTPTLPTYNLALPATGTSARVTVSRTEDASYTTYDTYFPLLMEPNTFKPMNGYVDPEDQSGLKKYNTGYIVSGANDTTSSAYQRAWGDIRISAYRYSSLKDRTNVKTRTAYLNGKESTDSGWVTLANVSQAANYKFQKYTASHAKMQDLLDASSDSGYIHGLHFMSAQISKANLASIGKAVVLDGKAPKVENAQGVLEDQASVYYDYQVPEDSVDFNLKSYGYINFFAGSYFSGNNCFFSLHQVDRDANNDIDDIREISKVYCPDYKDKSGNYLLGDEDHPYIYQYASGKWSSYSIVDGKWVCTPTSSEPDHGPLLFDCAWITARGTMSDACLYYFEIPVNAGEYALGSVAGRNGAYLLYLDIGAGAANYKDVTQNENILISITELEFPIGVDFVDLTSNPSDMDLVAPGGSSAVVAVTRATTTAVATKYTYTTDAETKESVLTLTKAGNDPPSMPASTFALEYADESASAKYLSDTLSLDSSATYTITMEREIIQSYNPNMGSGTLTFAYVEKYTISNGKNGRRIQLPNVAENGAEWTLLSGSGSASCTQEGLVTFTGTGNVVVQATWSSSSQIGAVTNWTPLSSNNPKGSEESPIVEFHFIDYSLGTATPPNVVVTYTYTGTKDPTTKQQSFVYNINVSNSSGKDVILVIDALKLSFPTESTTTYSVTITYGGNTYVVGNKGDTFTIPSSAA